MDSDFKPAQRPAKSLQATLDGLTAKTPTPDTSAFYTPEEVVAADDIAESAQLADNIAPAEPSTAGTGKSAGGWRAKLTPKWPFGRREWLVSAVITLISGCVVAFVLTHVGSKPVASATVTTRAIPKKVPPKPKTVASTLSGMQVDPNVNLKPVTGVMIENSLDSRPQSGLAQASVVFEAIAEGGITRFLALFQDTAPDDVGPIRSARPYYIQWALGFDAGYAHVGGSPEALADIKSWGVHDLDQFANGGSYHRINSRAAPHNVYTSLGALNQLETAKGYTGSTFTGFARKAAAPSKQPTAKSINLAFSGPQYNVHYDYNAATNSYNRSEGGAAHMDANGNKQISPNVVVALVMSYGLEADDHHSQYSTIGNGQAYIFQDGTVTIGQWSKTSDKSQFVFTDPAGKPLTLNPGQTWLSAIAGAGKVSYTP